MQSSNEHARRQHASEGKLACLCRKFIGHNQPCWKAYGQSKAGCMPMQALGAASAQRDVPQQGM